MAVLSLWIILMADWDIPFSILFIWVPVVENCSDILPHQGNIGSLFAGSLSESSYSISLVEQ